MSEASTFRDLRSALNEIGEVRLLRSITLNQQDTQTIVSRLASADLQRLGEKYAKGVNFRPDQPRLEQMDNLKRLRALVEGREAEIESLIGQVD